MLFGLFKSIGFQEADRVRSPLGGDKYDQFKGFDAKRLFFGRVCGLTRMR